MRKATTALMAVVVTAFVITGCEADSDACKGPRGVVTGKDRDYHHTTKTWDHDLTIRADGGAQYQKDVTSTAYRWYKVGSRYPSAKHCKGGEEA